MAFDYDPSVATALRLIDRFGRAVSIERLGAPGGTPSNPTPGTPTLHATVAAFFSYREDQIDGSNVVQGDVKALVPVLDIVPQRGDILVDGSARWTIIDPGTLKPGATVVMHVLQLRRVGG